MSGDECAHCGVEIDGEPYVDETEQQWLGRGNARTWCSEDCQIAAAEAAWERLYEQFHGGVTWP